MPTETIKSDVGAAVRAEMGRQRVTMVELSRRTGVPRSTLAYQINSDKLSLSSFVAIVAALGVKAADLLVVAA